MKDAAGSVQNEPTQSGPTQSGSVQNEPARNSRDYSQAAERARKHRTMTITVEGLGTIKLPPADELAFVGGLGLLAALGIVEWPVAGILTVAHLISRNSGNKTLKAFGEALDEA